tara:strand:+ start:700 stop:924 length:225 start_codon:yes stop_codon:yes gene_type:complete
MFLKNLEPRKKLKYPTIFFYVAVDMEDVDVVEDGEDVDADVDGEDVDGEDVDEDVDGEDVHFENLLDSYKKLPV